MMSDKVPAYVEEASKLASFPFEAYAPGQTLRICVTGAGGFIASHLAKRLKNEGAYVVACDWKRNEHMPVSFSAAFGRDSGKGGEEEGALTRPPRHALSAPALAAPTPYWARGGPYLRGATFFGIGCAADCGRGQGEAGGAPTAANAPARTVALPSPALVAGKASHPCALRPSAAVLESAPPAAYIATKIGAICPRSPARALDGRFSPPSATRHRHRPRALAPAKPLTNTPPKRPE
jgi:hypothetical protein